MANAPVAYIDSGRPGSPAYNKCRQIPIFNGVDQYLSIDTVNYPGVFDISFYARSDTNAFKPYLSGPTSDNFIRTLNNAGGLQVFIGGTGGISDSSEDYNDGKTRFIQLSRDGANLVTLTVDGTIRDSGIISDSAEFDRAARSWTTAAHLSGTIYNLKLSGSVDMPLNDGFANNPTAINRIGTDGTFINMTSAAWSEVCE